MKSRVQRSKPEVATDHSIENPSRSIDFRWWLKQQLSKRVQSNSRYSLRAFSKTLGLDSSSVSQIISGKRNISPKLLSRICDRLQAEPLETDQMIQSLNSRIDLKGNRSHRIGAIDSQDSRDSKADYVQIHQDLFAAISDRHHYAILELTFVNGFQGTPNWVAKELGIRQIEASMAMDRLLRLGLLVQKDGRLQKASKSTTNEFEGLTSAFHRKFQQQIIRGAEEALESFQSEEKDITSMTFAIDVNQLPEARKKIKKFRRKMAKFLESGNQTRVFHLGIQLYPASLKPQNQNSKERI